MMTRASAEAVNRAFHEGDDIALHVDLDRAIRPLASADYSDQHEHAIATTLRSFLVATFVVLITASGIKAQEPRVTVAEPDRNITVWWAVNVKGQLLLQLDSGEGADCAIFWWNRMGFNSEKFEVCDSEVIDYDLRYVFGRLRAGNFQKRTVVAVYATARPGTIELCGRVLEC